MTDNKTPEQWQAEVDCWEARAKIHRMKMWGWLTFTIIWVAVWVPLLWNLP